MRHKVLVLKLRAHSKTIMLQVEFLRSESAQLQS